jgi:phosphate transport system substrate-binding protein
MRHTPRTSRLIAASVVGLAVMATACAPSSTEDGAADAAAQETDGTASADAGDSSGAPSGTITISGSSTVEPVSNLVAEAFRGENPDVDITVDGPGTGDGFALFCEGETDISDASRPIAEDEAELCAENGVEFTKLKIGIDGITVLTNPANDAVECVSFTDLYAMLGPESEGFGSWSDANALAEELGGAQAAPYPDASLDVFAPGEESGTYDSFVELVFEDIAVERGVEAFARADYNASPNDNVIVQGLSGSDTSLGWVGFAFYVENQDALKALDVANERGECIAPTEETIASNEFPLSRDLFIYVNDARVEEKPALQQFVDYYLSDEGIASVSEAGYVQLADEDLQATRDAWGG